MRKLGSCMRSRTFLQPKAWEEGTKTTLGSTVLRRYPQIWRGKGREEGPSEPRPLRRGPKTYALEGEPRALRRRPTLGVVEEG